MLPGALPSHMHVGRAQRPGPVTGGYNVLCCGPGIAGQVTGAWVQRDAVWHIPHDVRVIAFGWRANSVTGNPTVRLQFHDGSSSVSNIMDAAVDIGANPDGYVTAGTAAGSGRISGPTRDPATYPFISANVLNNGGTVDLTCYVIFMRTEHINTDPDND